MAPSGTVTFLMSDVVGSTRQWAMDPEGMAASLRVHDDIFRVTAAEHDGFVFSTAGDSFAVAFGRASAATACAAALLERLQHAEWGSGPALSVRLGVHIGEADERDDDYFGPVVNLAARVMAAGHGGQCLLTKAVADSVRLPTVDLGAHRLRDIDEPVELFQLGAGEFPPLHGMQSVIVALPSPRTSLVGRDGAVAHVRRLLGASRLVTLTGVGGCGKTRLAIEVARREVGSFPGGVWFIDLSTISADDAIQNAFATAMGVVVTDRATVVAEIATYLAPREALLVVDNCEHVIDDVAEILDRLLAACAGLRVVATSREALEIDGEHAWKVPSLDADDGTAALLFRARARASGADVVDDAMTASVIDEIVRRLDGVPLAIELAAARTRSMRLDEIRDRLDDRFRILAGGRRRSGQRQATLEATVQWSFGLLTPREQRALCQLAVFQAGFDLADVGAVIGLDAVDAADVVDGLVAKSLVDVTVDGRGLMRHRLLESIRLFGLARLLERGEVESTRDLHLAHFLADDVGSSMDRWLDIASLWRIDREYENFRSAAEWAMERGRPDDAAMIAAILSDAAPRRGDAVTVIEWMRLGVNLTGRAAVYVQALLAHALNIGGRFEEGLTFLHSAIELGQSERCSDVVFAVCDLAVAVGFGGDPQGRTDLYEQARMAAEEYGGDNVTALAMMFELVAFVGVADHQRALDAAAQCSASAGTFGYLHIIEAWQAYALLQLGLVDEAREVVKWSAPIPPSSQWAHMNTVIGALVLARTEGSEAGARALASQAKEAVARRPALAAEFLCGFAEFAFQLGELERAERYSDLQGFGVANILIEVRAKLEGLDGLDPAGRLAFERREIERLSVAQRFANNASLADAWLAEELARWS